jgi:hypothetical protein
MKLMLLPFCLVMALPLLQAQPCTNRPVLMIHGFLGAGDNYAPLARVLEANGYCPSHLQVYDWNTLARNTPAEVQRLDSVIAAICQATGATQVDLVGHSAGGSLAYAYLNDSVRSKKVAHYIHIGSRPMAQAAGFGAQVPTLNVYSTNDRTVKGADIPGANNARFSSYDHFGLVTADSVASAILAFVKNGALPAIRKQRKAAPSTVTLRVLKMGENQPDSGAAIVCQALSPQGEQKGAAQTATTNQRGEVQLQNIASETPYWITCTPVKGRPVAYYFPQINSGAIPTYLRTLPATGMVNMLLGGIPKASDAAALVLFNTRAAISPERDVLLLNGDTLNTAAITPLAKTVVALFLYDNGDKQSSKQIHGLFGQAPFMNGVDYYVPATGTYTLQWQQKAYVVPAKPSAAFVTVVVLD